MIYSYVALTTLFCLCLVDESFADVECHSCFTHCKTLGNGKIDAEICDCTGEQTCVAKACFAKIEIFPEELTAIVQKGCITDVPGGFEGCQFAGQSESIHCYCTGELCNTRQKLNFYNTNQLPTVDCCECAETHGDQCPDKNCLRRCRGNYCLIDFEGVEQGCGLGYPRLQGFLRTKNYADWQGHTTCARYQATQSTVVHGCTCTNPTGSCNELNKTRTFQIEKVIERNQDEQNYCYSLHHKSKKPFGQEVFKNSDTCEGQYCFISLTTSELLVESANFEDNYDDHKDYVGLSRPRYEILAGCLKVDDDSKVGVGCTTEFSLNSSEPLARHCICDTHLCNFHHLLTGAADSRKRTQIPTSSRNMSSKATHLKRQRVNGVETITYAERSTVALLISTTICSILMSVIC